MPVFVPLDRVLDSPFQTRTRYDEAAVEALADAIERDGMLQTPAGRLTRTGDSPFSEPSTAEVLKATDLGAEMGRQRVHVQLAYGHTRARAWRRIWERRGGDLVAAAEGVHGVPVGTMPVELRPMTDDQMERLAWTENHDRSDLDPVDRAAAIAARVERHGWTHAEAGEALGLDRTTVSNILRWYGAFVSGGPAGQDALDAMRAGTVSEAVARALAGTFALAAEHPDAYRALTAATGGRLDDLGSLVRWAALAAPTAQRVRQTLDTWRAAFEEEGERRRREREPEMFDWSKPADRAEQEPAAPPETAEGGVADRFVAGWLVGMGVPTYLEIRGNHVHNGATLNRATTFDTAEGALDLLHRARPEGLRPQWDRVWTVSGAVVWPDSTGEDDGYDDGGAQLAAVAEARGMEPLADEPFAEPAGGAADQDAGPIETEDGEDGPIMVPYDYHGQLVQAESVDGFQHDGVNYDVSRSVTHVRDGEPVYGHQFTVVDRDGAVVVASWPTIELAIDKAREKLDAAGEGPERDSANEPWHLFDRAVHAALAGLSPDARRALTPALWPKGFQIGETTRRWKDAEAWGWLAADMVRDALIDDHTPESAADALGLDVDWGGEGDVSADTSDNGAAEPPEEVLAPSGRRRASPEGSATQEGRRAPAAADSGAAPAPPSGPPRTAPGPDPQSVVDGGGPYAAIGPDEHGRTIVLGLGGTPAEALRDAERWGDDGMEVDGVHPVDPDLAHRVDRDGAQDTVVEVREDGVVDLHPDHAPASPHPSGYPGTFPMQRRLRDAGIRTLDALLADVEAKGGAEGWLDFAVANYEGVGRSHGRRIVDALPAAGDGQATETAPEVAAS